MNIDFNPSKKQDEFFEAHLNPDIEEVLYGGAAGGGKSYILWAIAILQCLEHPEIRVGFARQTLAQIKKNSITSFYEVSKHFGLEPNKHYKYNSIDGRVTFDNKSVIEFYELRYLPSDPNYDRFGSALLTFTCIEEAGGVDYLGKTIFSARGNRWMNSETGIPGTCLMTCNPSMNFLYNDFYRPSQKGELEPFRYYISALLRDNPYIQEGYRRKLELTLDAESRSRLLDGEWDFDGDKSRLLKYEDVISMYDFDDVTSGNYHISADIAFTSDKCIILLWKGLDVIEIINYKGGEPEKEIIRLRDKYNVSPKNIVYDSDGVGKYLKDKLRGAYAFINNSKPLRKENYDNLKSQAYFKLAEKIRDGEVKIRTNDLKDELIQEVYEIKSQPLETLDGKLKLVKKKDVANAIGRSPDISDAMAYRMVFEIKGFTKPF